MTRSLIINMDLAVYDTHHGQARNHTPLSMSTRDTHKTDIGKSALCASKSLPDLADENSDLNSHIATLNITSEEINVTPTCCEAKPQLTHVKGHETSVHYTVGLQKPRSGTWSPESSNDYSAILNIQPSQTETTWVKEASSSGIASASVPQMSDKLNAMDYKQKNDIDIGLSVDIQKTVNLVVSKEDNNTDALHHDLNQGYNLNTEGCLETKEELSEFTDISLSVDDDPQTSITHQRLTNSLVPDSKRASISSLGSFFERFSAKQSAPSCNGSSLQNHLTQSKLEEVSSSSSSINTKSKECDKKFGVNHSKSPSYGRSKKIFWWSNKQVTEPLSTTALILEDRPSNLPSKPTSESKKHRLEYEKMVENAKKNELRELQKKKKKLKLRRKQEDSIMSVSSVWHNEVLPNWVAMHQTSRVRSLWWQGLPPSIRGKVWKLAIGNELNLTQDLYDIMVVRAHEKLRSIHETQSMGGEDTECLAVDRESTVELIRLDISRTFPRLCIFQKGGPYYDALHDILGAYACYRPDVGYVQGMSFIAAMLLLNMEPADVFLTFANLLNKPCQVAFFRLHEGMMKTYFAAFEVFFEENLPHLFAHFKHHNLTPDMYLIDWIFTMFSKSLCLDTASRVWDVFCRDGEEFLFKTALAILKLHRTALLSMEFIYAAQFLTKLPADMTREELLFREIADVSMVSRGGRRWKDVVALMQLQKHADDNS